MSSHDARRLDEEEVATLVLGLTMLLNENARQAADLGRHPALHDAERDLLSLTERQQAVVRRLLSELETAPGVTLARS